jgi:hypothetical protein
MEDAITIKFKIDYKKILSYIFVFLAGVLITAGVTFYFASKNASVNELKYKELEAKYELVNEKYNEDTKKLVDSNSILTTKISEAQEINNDMGSSLTNMGNTINDLKNTLINIRNLYLKQKEILE